MAARTMRVVKRVAKRATMCALAGLTMGAAPHPLHTTLAQIALDAARREITVSVRVFADDFGAAVARNARLHLAPNATPSLDAMYRYVTARLVLTDAAGHVLSLNGCGVRRAGEMLFVCLRGPVTPPGTGLRLRNSLLADVFEDQVNIVQYLSGTSRRTTMFTPGDGAKSLD